MRQNSQEKKVKSLTIWAGELELNTKIIPRVETHSGSGKKILACLNAMFVKMKSTHPLDFGQRKPLLRKKRGPPNILLVERNPITKTIPNLVKSRLHSFLGTPNTFGNKILWIWIGFFITERVWKSIPFQVGLYKVYPEEMQYRRKIFQASFPVKHHTIYFAQRAKPYFWVSNKPNLLEALGRKNNSQVTLWNPWWSIPKAQRKSCSNFLRFC